MQQWLIRNKNIIIRTWGFLLIAWFIFFLISTQIFSPPIWVWIGKKVGTASLITFWVVLTPGIMKRFQIAGWLLPLRTMLMLFRRQIGITTYILAFTHYWWSRMLPIIYINGDIFAVEPFELMGFAALALLTPLFLTSNDWSMRKLGRWWDKIHSLVYIVIWILFLHVALNVAGIRSLITLIVAALELFSLIWAKRRQLNTTT